MRYFYFLLFVFISVNNYCQTDLQLAANNFAQYEGFKNASISLKVIELSTGNQVAGYDMDRSISPASTVKLFSTATALEILGPSYQPKTSIYYDGELKNGILNGNLLVLGGGDPTLGSSFFQEVNSSSFLTTWVDKIKAAGIKEIKGQIITDGSQFGYLGAPEDWNWSDMGNYYGAGPSGICIYDNMLKYHFQTKGIGEKTILTKTTPVLDSLYFLNNILGYSGNSDNSYIFGAPFSYDRQGIGKLPDNRSEFIVKGSLPDPELQLAIDLYAALKAENILVSNGFDNVRKRLIAENDMPNYASARLIFEHLGPKLQEIIQLTNHKSINLFAEQLICLAGFEKTKDGSTEAGLNQMYLHWKNKISKTGLYLKDGSGLSRSNAVSANHFCELLYQMSLSKNAAVFKSSLPVVGISGTVAGMCKGTIAQGRIHAKSGTMNRTKSYAGYLETLSGKKLAFSISVNNFNCSNSTTVEQIEKLMVEMVKYP